MILDNDDLDSGYDDWDDTLSEFGSYDEIWSDDPAALEAPEDYVFDISTRPVTDIKLVTVEVAYEPEAPLQDVFDELSVYVVENKLDFAVIHSVHNYTEDDGYNILVVTFSL